MAEEHVDTAPTEEQVTPAQEAVETNTPFEGEFDPERARRTIDNLRNREKELEQQLKSDEWFQRQLEERGLALPDDDEEEPEPAYDDPRDERIAALEQAEQERRLERIYSDLDAHIGELASESGVELTQRMKQWIARESEAAGNGMPDYQATIDAFNALNEELEQYGKAAVDRYLKSKRAPTPPSKGSQAQPSGDFDPKSDRSRKERMAAILAREP